MLKKKCNVNSNLKAQKKMQLAENSLPFGIYIFFKQISHSIC
jgi:hypothetical protein